MSSRISITSTDATEDGCEEGADEWWLDVLIERSVFVPIGTVFAPVKIGELLSDEAGFLAHVAGP